MAEWDVSELADLILSFLGHMCTIPGVKATFSVHCKTFQNFSQSIT